MQVEKQIDIHPRGDPPLFQQPELMGRDMQNGCHLAVIQLVTLTQRDDIMDEVLELLVVFTNDVHG